MNYRFDVPSNLQDDANRLPAQVARASVMFGGGQHQNVTSPWASRARHLQPHYGTAPLSSDLTGEYRGGGYFVPSVHDPVGHRIEDNQLMVSGYQSRVDASHQMSLGRIRGGSLNKITTRVSGLGLTKSQEESNRKLCGQWAFDSAVWDDPRNPIAAFFAYVMVERPDRTFGGHPSMAACVLGRLAYQLEGSPLMSEVKAGKAAEKDIFIREFPELNSAIVEAGGLSAEGAAGIVGALLWTGAKLYKWTSRDVRRITEAAKKVDWTSSDWLNQWAEASKEERVPAKAGGVKHPWYENPWILGAGAAAVVGGVWFATR